MKYYFLVFALLLAAFFASCGEDSGDYSPVISTHRSQDDSTAAADTFFIRDTVYIYADTVFDTSFYDTIEYKSFIYQKGEDLFDTVTARAEDLDCQVTKDSLHCKLREIITHCYTNYTSEATTEDRVIKKENDIVKAPYPESYTCPTNKICKRVKDTIYVDSAYHYRRLMPYTYTTKLNYGKKPLTKYVPYTKIPPLNKDSIREWLDTLDSRLIYFGAKAFSSPYTLTSKQLPYWASIRDVTQKYRVSYILPCYDTTYTNYPLQINNVSSAPFNELQAPLANDITVTWDLFYENQYGIKDSMEVTSVFLGKKDTIYKVETLYVYKDTVYDTSYIDNRYQSFIYQEDSSHIDTVTALAKNMECEISADSFHCHLKELAGKNCRLISPTIISNTIPSTTALELDICKKGSVCETRQETVFLDSTLHINETVTLDDTTRINYGENALSSYIPDSKASSPNKSSEATTQPQIDSPCDTIYIDYPTTRDQSAP